MFQFNLNLFSKLLTIVAISQTAVAQTPLQEKSKNTLSFMHDIYESMYAPLDWKKKYANWDLEEQVKIATKSIEENPDLNLSDVRGIFKSFIYSMQDYHVSISFYSTEKASLPFTVRGADDKLFIVHINRSKLSEATFPFNVGDELVTFGDLPALQAVKDLQSEIPANTFDTDRAFAELILTNRNISRVSHIPKGPITIGIKPKGSDRVKNVQLIWEYTPEYVNEQKTSPFSSNLDFTKGFNSNRIFSSKMIGDVSWLNNDHVAMPYYLGVRESFLPDLGTKIWESGESDLFQAYIFQTTDRRLIGYVRIPTYYPQIAGMDDESILLAHVQEFSKIIQLFESSTDALVVDQLNNPGGYIAYMYALASMLTDQPLKTPKHRMTLSPALIAASYAELIELEKIKNENDVAKFAPSGFVNGYPVNYELIQFVKDFNHFRIAEWNAGKRMTSPYYIEGVDHINPSPMANYSKPILVLVNELDISCGDFFPAILQDNKRATIFGQRTSGAGGYVLDVPFPNSLGISYIRYTGSIAERADTSPIENLGVTPDIEYRVTADDLSNNFSPYINRIHEALSELTK